MWWVKVLTTRSRLLPTRVSIKRDHFWVVWKFACTFSQIIFLGRNFTMGQCRWVNNNWFNTSEKSILRKSVRVELIFLGLKYLRARSEHSCASHELSPQNFHKAQHSICSTFSRVIVTRWISSVSWKNWNQIFAHNEVHITRKQILNSRCGTLHMYHLIKERK